MAPLRRWTRVTARAPAAAGGGGWLGRSLGLMTSSLRWPGETGTKCQYPRPAERRQNPISWVAPSWGGGPGVGSNHRRPLALGSGGRTVTGRGVGTGVLLVCEARTESRNVARGLASEVSAAPRAEPVVPGRTWGPQAASRTAHAPPLSAKARRVVIPMVGVVGVTDVLSRRILL